MFLLDITVTHDNATVYKIFILSHVLDFR